MVVISASIAVIAKVDIIVLVFGYMVIPGILSVLSAASCVRGKRIENSKLLSVLSGMSYQFFLAQLFLWKITGGAIGGVRYQWKYGKNFCFINMLYFYIVYCMVLL